MAPRGECRRAPLTVPPRVGGHRPPQPTPTPQGGCSPLSEVSCVYPGRRGPTISRLTAFRRCVLQYKSRRISIVNILTVYNKSQSLCFLRAPPDSLTKWKSTTAPDPNAHVMKIACEKQVKTGKLVKTGEKQPKFGRKLNKTERK